MANSGYFGWYIARNADDRKSPGRGWNLLPAAKSEVHELVEHFKSDEIAGMVSIFALFPLKSVKSA